MHNLFTEKFSKTEFSGNDGKRLQTRDEVISYPYGAVAGGVCNAKLIEYEKMKI